MNDIVIIINESKSMALIGDISMAITMAVLGGSAIYYENGIWSVFSILSLIFVFYIKIKSSFTEDKFVRVKAIKDAIDFLEKKR